MRKKIKFVYRYAKKYRFQMLIILSTILVTTFIVAMYPYIFGQLVDSLYYKNSMSGFLNIAGMYCVIFIVNQLLHFALDMVYANLQTKFVFDIKRSIFTKVLAYRGSRLSSLQIGDVIYRIDNDADEVVNFIYSDIFYGLSAFLDFFVCLGMTAYISLPFAGISILLAVLTFCISKFFGSKLSPINKKIANMTSQNQSWLFEVLNAMRDIKLLNAAKYCVDKFMKKDKDIIKVINHKVKEETIADRSNAAVSMSNLLCIYVASAIFIVTGMLTLGKMIACIDYFNRITLMLQRLYVRTFTISSRFVSIDRLMEIDDGETESYKDNIPLKIISHGDIKLSNVVFSYRQQVKVLDGVSLHIYPGERMALVGKSGAGKSTIADLLCKIYDLDQGEITIDGIDIDSYNLRDLRSQIGVIHQQSYLFNQSIRYNLLFSNETDRDDQIWEVLTAVKLTSVIKSLPEGLDTILSASTTAMSGGQEQRLVLARLYLKNPQIVILDESTSALDEKTESDIADDWNRLFKDRTMIIISHRFSTILKSDRVAYLEDGKIMGCDCHAKLLESCPQYYQLYMKQSPHEEEGESNIE